MAFYIPYQLVLTNFEDNRILLMIPSKIFNSLFEYIYIIHTHTEYFISMRSIETQEKILLNTFVWSTTLFKIHFG